MTPCALYRHFDADGQLLYVGVSQDLTKRTREHRRLSPWFPDVARTDTQVLMSREHALALEAVAIRFEAPRYNKSRQREKIDTSSEREVEVLRAMEEHAEIHCVKLSSIGQMAAQNRNAYDRIKAGSARRATIEKIAAWIERDRIARTGGAT